MLSYGITFISFIFNPGAILPASGLLVHSRSVDFCQKKKIHFQWGDGPPGSFPPGLPHTAPGLTGHSENLGSPDPGVRGRSHGKKDWGKGLFQPCIWNMEWTTKKLYMAENSSNSSGKYLKQRHSNSSTTLWFWRFWGSLAPHLIGKFVIPGFLPLSISQGTKSSYKWSEMGPL